MQQTGSHLRGKINRTTAVSRHECNGGGREKATFSGSVLSIIAFKIINTVFPFFLNMAAEKVQQHGSNTAV